MTAKKILAVWVGAPTIEEAINAYSWPVALDALELPEELQP